MVQKKQAYKQKLLLAVIIVIILVFEFERQTFENIPYNVIWIQR